MSHRQRVTLATVLAASLAAMHGPLVAILRVAVAMRSGWLDGEA